MCNEPSRAVTEKLMNTKLVASAKRTISVKRGFLLLLSIVLFIIIWLLFLPKVINQTSPDNTVTIRATAPMISGWLAPHFNNSINHDCIVELIDQKNRHYVLARTTGDKPFVSYVYPEDIIWLSGKRTFIFFYQNMDPARLEWIGFYGTSQPPYAQKINISRSQIIKYLVLEARDTDITKRDRVEHLSKLMKILPNAD